jgi:hypothetical protein
MLRSDPIFSTPIFPTSFPFHLSLLVWQNELEEFIVTFYHSEWRRSDLIRRRFVEARKILGSATPLASSPSRTFTFDSWFAKSVGVRVVRFIW